MAHVDDIINAYYGATKAIRASLDPHDVRAAEAAIGPAAAAAAVQRYCTNKKTKRSTLYAEAAAGGARGRWQ